MARDVLGQRHHAACARGLGVRADGLGRGAEGGVGGDKAARHRMRPAKNVKHKHGTPNPIILSEENTVLAVVDRALSSSGNAQVIGRNGEIPLRGFFSRYLPFTLRAATGHFVTPQGHLSPQVDVLVLDARYPLLADNPDGTVLAMLHAVVATLEVKTRLTTRDVQKGWENARHIMKLAAEVKGYGDVGGWTSVQTDGIAYRLAQSLETIDSAYVNVATPHAASFDVSVLRLPPRDQPPGGTLGAEMHMEPVEGPEDYIPTCRLTHTALSDVYYHLVQTAYYVLHRRDWSFDDIGAHFLDYMAWATASWKQYATLRQGPRSRRRARRKQVNR
jgi:hypothetical protein